MVLLNVLFKKNRNVLKQSTYKILVIPLTKPLCEKIYFITRQRHLVRRRQFSVWPGFERPGSFSVHQLSNILRLKNTRKGSIKVEK